jgi:hypothetical protein
LEPEFFIAVSWVFREGHFELSRHAYVEMYLDKLNLDDVRKAGARGEVLEDYPDRPEGYTILIAGYIGQERPVHLVVNIAAFEDDPSRPVSIVTVYVPEPPRWRDERTRGRKGR